MIQIHHLFCHYHAFICHRALQVMAAQSEGRLVEMFGSGTAAVVSISLFLFVISLFLFVISLFLLSISINCWVFLFPFDYFSFSLSSLVGRLLIVDVRGISLYRLIICLVTCWFICCIHEREMHCKDICNVFNQLDCITWNCLVLGFGE